MQSKNNNISNYILLPKAFALSAFGATNWPKMATTKANKALKHINKDFVSYVFAAQTPSTHTLHTALASEISKIIWMHFSQNKINVYISIFSLLKSTSGQSEYWQTPATQP